MFKATISPDSIDSVDTRFVCPAAPPLGRGGQTFYGHCFFKVLVELYRKQANSAERGQSPGRTKWGSHRANGGASVEKSAGGAEERKNIRCKEKQIESLQHFQIHNLLLPINKQSTYLRCRFLCGDTLKLGNQASRYLRETNRHAHISEIPRGAVARNTSRILCNISLKDKMTSRLGLPSTVGIGPASDSGVLTRV
eukprot:6190335-Pleurochrysis_carterae.AAC.2